MKAGIYSCSDFMDSGFRDCVKTQNSVIPAQAGIYITAPKLDSNFRWNDDSNIYNGFHTASFAGMTRNLTFETDSIHLEIITKYEYLSKDESL